MNYSIGQNIKNYRKQLGLTQEELASQLYVTAQAVSKWESDGGLPDTAQIVPLAKALNISTDALFGLENADYDQMAAKKAQEILRDCKADLDVKAGALRACELMIKECDANPMNYEVYMRYVQAVANLSRWVNLEGFLKDEDILWKNYHDEAVRKAVQVIRYCKDSNVVEMTHYALAWIYYHDHAYDKAREHIAKLPSIKSNMLQEAILPYFIYSENGDDYKACMKETMNGFQFFCLALNKQFFYACERSLFGGNNALETIEICDWALNVIKALTGREEMMPYCQGFVKDIYAFKIQAQIWAGQMDAAVESYGKIKKIILDYAAHCEELRQKDDLAKSYDDKGILNINRYTAEDAQRRIDELSGKIEKWCGKDIKMYTK